MSRILDLVSHGDLRWLVSSVLRMELSRNPDAAERETSLAFLELASTFIYPTSETYQRGFVLRADGYGEFDALHLALAEEAGVEWLITVDDRFLRRASKRPETSRPIVINPVDWIRRGHLWLLKH